MLEQIGRGNIQREKYTYKKAIGKEKQRGIKRGTKGSDHEQHD